VFASQPWKPEGQNSTYEGVSRVSSHFRTKSDTYMDQFAYKNPAREETRRVATALHSDRVKHACSHLNNVDRVIPKARLKILKMAKIEFKES
jgi:hypothetical protein